MSKEKEDNNPATTNNKIDSRKVMVTIKTGSNKDRLKTEEETSLTKIIQAINGRHKITKGSREVQTGLRNKGHLKTKKVMVTSKNRKATTILVVNKVFTPLL